MTAPAPLHLVTPLDQLRAAMNAKREVVLSGAAGTGKTTLVRELLADNDLNTFLVAPTARAAGRMRAVTGHDATTLHSFLYQAPVEHWRREDGSECRKDGRPCGSCACSLELTWPGKTDELERGGWVIVDEASMVTDEVAGALRARVADLDLGVGILWVGDPAQLPPVGRPAGVDLRTPDVALETVWRTERPGVLELCTEVRNAEVLADLQRILAQASAGRFAGVVRGERAWQGAAEWRAERPQRMLITHRNKDRIELNRLVRSTRNRTARIATGERLLIRTNNRNAKVYNGDLFVVTECEVTDQVARVSCHDPEDGTTKTFVVVLELLDTDDRDAFHRGKYTWRNPWADQLVNAQYGYALTCHAAQGCEADEVGVVWTGGDWWRAAKDAEGFADARAWLYTAVSRAKQSVTLWQVA